MIPRMRSARHGLLFAGLLLVGGMFLSACSSDSSSQPSIYDRQEQALQHPFDYKPDIERPDGSGHSGISDWDSQGMKKDVDDVLNP